MPLPLPALDFLIAVKVTADEIRAADEAVDQGRRADPEARLSRGDVLRKIFRLGVRAYLASLERPAENEQLSVEG